jgi:hypothetical protein
MTQTLHRRADRSGGPASYAQELLWHLDRATPGMTAYNVPRVIRIRGALDVEALRAARDHNLARQQ